MKINLDDPKHRKVIIRRLEDGFDTDDIQPLSRYLDIHPYIIKNFLRRGDRTFFYHIIESCLFYNASIRNIFKPVDDVVEGEEVGDNGKA